ncbi:MAG: hypothetical protein CMJ76_07720 [Planctomycetaceae bacterium]|nr:hypothetical protein [Planctomycetaceae bacterium]|tara:strand:- start:2001 stop:2687 length:687 start_codon:yes stop_codon:yes gene_type:complete
MYLYLIRHGQSENNALDESLRVQDPGLTEAGVAQVEYLARWFAVRPLDVLITSPFRRALLTTVPIAKVTGLSPIVRTAIHEVGGCVSGYPEIGYRGEPGMSDVDIRKAFPGFDPEADIDEQGWWKSKPYESVDDRMVRVQHVARQIVEEYDDTDKHVALVMHADFKHLLLQHLLPDLPLDARHFGALRNAGVSTLKVENGKAILENFNGIQHMPADIVTPVSDSETRV